MVWGNDDDETTTTTTTTPSSPSPYSSSLFFHLLLIPPCLQLPPSGSFLPILSHPPQPNIPLLSPFSSYFFYFPLPVLFPPLLSPFSSLLLPLL